MNYLKMGLFVIAFTLVVMSLGILSGVIIQDKWKEKHEIQKKNCRFIVIEKTKDGFNTYTDNELQWEFTKQNTVSLSLQTLDMIFEGDSNK